MNVNLQPTVHKCPRVPLRRSLVVWALDAFSKDVESHARTAHAIRAHAPDCEIQPVYVLSEDVFSARGYSSFLRAALKPRARHNLLALLEHDLLAEVKKSGLLRTPRILVETSAEASRCTGKLLRYAKRKGATCVAIGTHARGALSRWFAGSFAETLIRESRIPLLIAGPRQQDSLRPPRALVVPTDFHPDDREAFEDLVRLARRRELALHLFHHAPTSFETWTAASLITDTWVSVDAFFDEDEVQEAKRWLKTTTDAGVETHLTTPPPDHDSFTEALLDYARGLGEIGPVIAMLNATSAGLPARLTRDLIRTSPYPLYIAGHA